MAKSPWLQEVEDDAVRIQTRRFNEYFEDQKFEADKLVQKAAPKEEVSVPTPETVLAQKGK